MSNSLKIVILILSISLLTACGNEPNITPNTDESRIIIDDELSTVSLYAVMKNENRNKVGPLYAKFIIHDETLQEAIGAEVIDFTLGNAQKQPFYIDGNEEYFISESFLYDAQLDDDELINMVEVVISDENGMEMIQFLIPNVKKHEAPFE